MRTAYDAAANFIAGPKATLNFPLTDYEVVEPPRKPPEWIIEVSSRVNLGVAPSLAFERYVLRNQKPETEERSASLFLEEDLLTASFEKHIAKGDTHPGKKLKLGA